MEEWSSCTGGAIRSETHKILDFKYQYGGFEQHAYPVVLLGEKGERSDRLRLSGLFRAVGNPVRTA